jgi:hypothetical protein
MAIKFDATVLVFVVSAALVILVSAKAVVDTLATFDFVRTKWPRVFRWADSKTSQGVLLLVCICLLMLNAHEMRDIVFPVAPPPVPLFILTPPAFKQTPTRESHNSLRRRTVRLSREITAFWNQNPTPPQAVANPSTDEDKQRNAKWDSYWRTMQSAYDAEYRDRVVGIIREYKSKGVPTGWLEQAAENRPLGGFPFTQVGSAACWQDEMCVFRELSFHVDANDQLIRPDF